MAVGTASGEAAEAALKKHFGFDRFRAGQQETIGHLLDGRSAAAVFPTGGGKSLCYQLPALMLPGLTVVVSPLIALMKDQIDALAKRGIAAARLDSSLSAEEYCDVTRRVRDGALKMLYVAPERFANERFREAIGRVRIALFAVDEAHCISEWGHNFRPDYLKLARFAQRCGAERVLGLTATATGPVLDDICRLFEIEPECAVRTGFYRPNLTILTSPVEADRRYEQLVEKLRERPAGPTIVYVTLQRTAEQVADRLAADRFPARPYHAGLRDELRAKVQDWFLGSDRAVVVATIAFGMGIDKSNIRYVYHYNLPKSLENYCQEIGRAGRDGDPAICEMLACPDDLSALESFVFGDTPSLASVRGLVGEIFTLGDQFDVSPYDLSARHDIRMLVARTLLTYLELDGLLEGGTPFYATYQFKPLVPSAKILDQFDAHRREFLAGLFRRARKGKTWFSIDVDQAAADLHVPRERVVRALDHLHDEQLLEVRAAGVRHQYRRLRTPDGLDPLATSLHDRLVERETRDLGRIEEVLDLVRRDGCQVAALSAHFEESLDEACGHCSWCLNGQTPAQLPDRKAAAIDPGRWHQAQRLRRDRADILSDARSFTRLLCGVRSPHLTRAKLTRDPLFGSLADVPFQTVLERASAEE